MTADVSGLRDKVRERCGAIFDGAVADLVTSLDDLVPDSDLGPDAGNPYRAAPAEKLRDSRTIIEFDSETRFAAVVTYLADQAKWTDEGTEAHPISATAGGPPLTFFWPRIGGIGHFREVMWEPGPGVEKNRGWFTRTMQAWGDHLARAQDGLG